ncbi:MAG: uroporphyrinogen-III synthase [Bacteroidales bacterium]|jgi:uroporphyrinogen-III synthase|nr:uroporphyrinogen-III synthase [Bacteroidales bacterium]
MKIKNVLVSQPKPETEKSPYFDLAKKYNLRIDFRPFVQVEGVPVKEFRQSKVDIAEHTAIIFNSRTAIDHFFRTCEEIKVPVNDMWKYFCFSEAIAHYLQKYVVYRKRKIFYGNSTFDDLLTTIQKFPDEKYLVPLSDVHKQEIPSKLTKANINFTKAILYRTVSAKLSDINIKNYDVLVFFSPAGVASLKQNFPDFVQEETCIGAFGPTTAKAVENLGLRLDINAPIPEAPSMPAALELFIRANNK